MSAARPDNEAISVLVKGLGKRFWLGESGRPRGLHEAYERLVARGAVFIGARGKGESVERESLWALRNLEFSVAPGELIGLIGNNGAGKSVLLKILSRITYPTEGYAEVAGRIGSMLEVGAGFHPEFTGRENVFLVGAILGMPADEINARFDDIVRFAEVENFLETPVKKYSSGMAVRLAFAVASHLDANIMLFDEVISVGDTAFREKCEDKVRAMALEGRTVFFVSHNMQTIANFCPRVLLLESGQLSFDGSSAEGLERLRAAQQAGGAGR